MAAQLPVICDKAAVYPLKVVSRTLPATRTGKLRFSWFLLGAVFGVGCALALAPIINPPSWSLPHAAQNAQPAAVPEVAATAPIPTPVAAIPIAQPTVTAPAPARIAAAAPPAAAPKPIYPMALELKVENGDTLLSLLTDAGVPYDEAHNTIDAIHKVYDPKKLDIGQHVSVHLDKAAGANATPFITSMTLPVSPLSSLEVKRVVTSGGDARFEVKKIDTPTERKVSRVSGQIRSSIYETAVGAGLPPAMVAEIISAYSYDVDFQREIKEGDNMDVLYERVETKSGANAGHGNLIFAELDLGDRELRIYRYVDNSGHGDYYNEKGESVRKALLRTPVNGAKITSGYGMRNHPILGYSRMHRGVDFGAPVGTPIYAAGDGTVQFVGRKGGYGNYLLIKHNDKYASAYAHISRFASGIAPGRKVRQGQVVAYVGQTGMATGPHLHYEILVKGEQVNPANVKFKTGNVLGGKELLAFRQDVAHIDAQLAAMPKTGNTVAMADSGRSRTSD